MTNTGKQIAALMMDTSKPAPVMTHALKVLGKGNMQQGLAQIGEYYTTESINMLKKGRIQGAVFGIAGAGAIGLTCWVISKVKKDNAHEAEGQKILRCMKESIADAEINKQVSESETEDTE